MITKVSLASKSMIVKSHFSPPPPPPPLPPPPPPRPPQYQRVFMPMPGASQFVFPENYFRPANPMAWSGNNGTNYYGNSRPPYPPFG